MEKKKDIVIENLCKSYGEKQVLTDLNLTVYEGESENSEECNLLGSVELKLDGKLNYGEPIEVTLSKDKNGILQVEAIHQQSGLHIKSEIKRENGLTEKEVITSTNEMEELWLA